MGNAGAIFPGMWGDATVSARACRSGRVPAGMRRAKAGWLRWLYSAFLIETFGSIVRSLGLYGIFGCCEHSAKNFVKNIKCCVWSMFYCNGREVKLAFSARVL